MNPDGWPLSGRLAAAVASGLLLNLAFPPADQRWVAFVALIPLCLALRGASARSGALAGLGFGLGFFGVLLWWVSSVGVAAWGALVAAQAAFLGLFGLLAARVGRLGLPGRVIGVPLLWAGLEMMRARYPLGGFTWGGLGYTQHSGGPALPLARVGGVFLLGLAIVIVNALIAAVLTPGRARVLAGCALVIWLAPGALPLGIAGQSAGTLDVAAVQGNVPRGRFSGVGRRGRVGPEDLTIVENHLRVTELLLGGPRPDLIVWPENSFDRDPRANPAMLDPAVGLIRRIGAPLLAGAILDAPGDRFTNTNLLIDPVSGIVQRYDKLHLVPFGEQVPLGFLRRIVPALDRELPTDGVAGRHIVVFGLLQGARVGSVICFESTYPALVRDFVRSGAQALVVTTNNATFGTGPAARQHLAMSQMRAVEHGRAVVHAAIAGISAIVAPDGRVLERAELFRPALLRARLPLTDGQTPYTRYGASIELVMGFGALVAATVPFARARRRKEARA